MGGGEQTNHDSTPTHCEQNSNVCVCVCVIACVGRHSNRNGEHIAAMSVPEREVARNVRFRLSLFFFFAASYLLINEANRMWNTNKTNHEYSARARRACLRVSLSQKRCRLKIHKRGVQNMSS